jgi:iron complex outermembrane receptor protein
MGGELGTRAGLATLAVLVVWSEPALAQRQSADTNPEIIITAQQKRKQVESNASVGVLGEKDALSTPFNVSSYTAQLVLDQQSQTIGEVLQNDPAVRMSYGSGNQSELFVIRGFQLFGDDISIDGLYGIAPRQLVSPELYDSIQVINGANAFLFGAAPGGSGIGGAVNLVPKRAQRTLVRATASWIQDSIFGGNFDAGTRFGPDGQLGARLNGVYRKGTASIDHERREVRAAGLDLDFHRGAGRVYLDAGYEYQRADWSRPIVRLAATSTVPAPPRASYNFGQPWTYTMLRDFYALSRVELDVTSHVMLYAVAGFRRGLEEGDYSTLTITNGTTGAATGSRLYVPRSDHNQSGTAGLRIKMSTGPISHQINGGGLVTYLLNRNSFAFGAFPTGVGSATATTFVTNLYNAVIKARPADTLVSGSFTDLPKVTSIGQSSLFLSDTLGILDDAVQLTAGVRTQHLVINGYNRVTGVRTAHYDNKATTPVVGLILRPLHNLSFYANRIEGLSQGPTAPVNATTINPGQIFAPFRSVQYEAGVKVAFRGLTGTAAVYRTKQPSAFSRPVPGSATLTEFVVEGEQRNQGLELTLNGEPSRFVRLIGGISINDAKQTKTLNGVNNGKKAIGVPDYQANVGVEVVPPFFRHMTLTGRFVATGKQMANIINTQELPAWTRWDLGMRYVAVAGTHPITLRLSAENVTNKSYWSSASGGYLYQGLPRTIKGSITFEY